MRIFERGMGKSARPRGAKGPWDREDAMRKNERKTKSVKTLFAAFSMTMLVTLLIFSVVLIMTAAQALLSENLQYIEEDQAKFRDTLDDMYAEASSAAERLQYDSASRALLSAAGWDQISMELVREVTSATAEAQLGGGIIREIAFVGDLVAHSNLFLPAQLEQMREQMPDVRGLVPLGIHTSSRPDGSAYFVFGYHYYIGRERVGALLISAEMKGTTSLLEPPGVPGCLFVLTDARGERCLFGDTDEIPQEHLERLRERAGEANGETVYTGHWLLRSSRLDKLDSELLCVVNRWQNLPSLDASYVAVIIFLVLFAGLLIFATRVFYRNVISPLNEFSRTIAFIREKGLRKLDEPLVLNGCTEIQTLGRDFSDLLVSINTLTGEILAKSNALYEAECLRQSAELDMLRSQINPHFLYNTLELIRAMAIRGDTRHVSMITSAMGRIYRYTVKGESIVPLSQEIDIVKSYVSIQQARFAGRVTTVYSVTPDAARIPVFKMLLQPIVENAFVHGLESRGEDGTLYLGAMLEDGMLCISVRDNGAGLTQEKQLELEKRLSGAQYDPSGHLGLSNIAARLRLQYGDRASLHISGAPGDGTCVDIRIPISNASQKGVTDVQSTSRGR